MEKLRKMTKEMKIKNKLKHDTQKKITPVVWKRFAEEREKLNDEKGHSKRTY